jgi:hypothetical protein
MVRESHSGPGERRFLANRRKTHDRWSRNMANPMVGCRAQQTCTMSSGESRRSREERQGRNESGGWQLRAEGNTRAGWRQPPKGNREQAALTSEGGSREWTLGMDVDGGANIDNPKRGVPIWMNRRRQNEKVSGPTREGRNREVRGRTARAGKCLRRRGEGHEGLAMGHPTPGRTRTGSPSQVRATFKRTRHKTMEGQRRRPTIRNLDDCW